MNKFELEYEGKKVIFSNEKDYLERLSYIENGLKFTKIDSTNAYCFNDGSRMYVVKIIKDNSLLSILHKGGRVIKDKRQTKKYVELIKELPKYKKLQYN